MRLRCRDEALEVLAWWGFELTYQIIRDIDSRNIEHSYLWREKRGIIPGGSAWLLELQARIAQVSAPCISLLLVHGST